MTGVIIGALAGLLGVAVGIGAMVVVWRGTVSRWLAIRPDRPVPTPCSGETLRARLLACDNPDEPFHVTADPASDAIVASWRFLDASWQQFFGRFHATEDYRATLTLVPAHHEVRVLETRRSLRVGPGEGETSYFQGVVLFEKSRYREWALTGTFPAVPRDTASFDFDVRRIKAPLMRTTLACGWTWVPVTRHAHLALARPLA